MKKLVTLLSFVAAFSLCAQERCPAPVKTPEGVPPNLQNILGGTLPVCELSDTPAFKEFVVLYPENAPQGYFDIGGVFLKGDKEILSFAKEMVSDLDPALWKEKAKNCTNVLCVFGNLFNNDREAVLRLFNIAKRNGYIIKLGAYYKNSPTQLFSGKEIANMDEAFQLFPPELNKLTNLSGYYRNPDGFAASEAPDAAAYAVSGRNNTGIVALQQPAFLKGPAYTRQSVTHETCHHYDYQALYKTGKRLIDQPSFGFNELSAWKKVTDTNGRLSWIHDEKASFVTKYAATIPGEDFAETCAFYVNNPEELKEKAPLKYQFMKEKVFGGKEFPGYRSEEALEAYMDDESLCSNYLSSCQEIIYVQPNCSVFATYEDDTTQTYSYANVDSQSWLFDHACFQTARENHKTRIVMELGRDKDRFCSAGGENGIRRELDNRFCKKTLDKTLDLCKQSKEMPEYLNAAKANCGAKKDNSTECLIKYLETLTPLKLSRLNPEARAIFYKKVLKLK